jgi:hypothetical protein
VGLHRVLLDDEVAGDLRVGQPAGHQAEHIKLPRGEGGQRFWRLAGARRPGGEGEPGDKPPGDDRVDQRVPGGHAAHGDDQLIGRRVLEQEPADPGAQRLVDVLVGVEGGEDQDPGRRAECDDLAGGPQAVEDRHPDVEQRDGGAVLAHQGDRLRAVPGLRDHADVRRGLEDRSQALPDQALVVGEHDGDRLIHRGAPLC